MWTARKWLASGVGAIALGIVAVAPAVAAADTTYCVPSTAIAGCPAGATAEPTVAAALAAVNQNSGAHDVVRIGPGTFDEGGLADDAGHRVDIIGEGEGSTVIAPSSVPAHVGLPGEVVLAINEPSSTLSDLSITLPPGDDNVGLSLLDGPSVSDVAITAPTTATNAEGVFIEALHPSTSPATLSRIRVSLPGDGTGVVTGLGPAPTIGDSTILAGTGVAGTGLVQRSRIDANVDLVPGGDSSNGLLTVDSSVLQATSGAKPESAVAAVAPPSGSSGMQQVLLRHDTILGDGASGSTGITCTSAAANSCAVEVDGSIIWGFDHAIVRSADSTSSNAYAEVYVVGSDLAPTTDESTEITPPNPGLTDGGIVLVPGSLDVAPGFASTNPASSLAWELPHGSPLIDGSVITGTATTGPPVFTTTPPPASTTDFYGRPRAVAAHPGGLAAADIGATEYQALPPTVTASANATRVRVGAPVQFTAVASDPDPGDVVSLVWHFDNGDTARGSVAAHTFAAAGRHTVKVIASDLDGNSVTSVLHLTVTVPAPRLTQATLGAPAFRAAPSGPSILSLSHRAGTTIAYSDSRGATATLVVLERATGVRHGRTCVAPPHRGSAGQHVCTRWVRIGSFTHRDRRGRNAFRFSGRVGGRTLVPGRYVLELTARNSTGRSPVRRLSFTILR
jgi:hypothetical protein